VSRKNSSILFDADYDAKSQYLREIFKFFTRFSGGNAWQSIH